MSLRGNHRRPLEGIKVLALEQFLAAPFGTMMLADAGAEVVKVEAPGIGDGYREMPPIIENERGKTSYGMLRLNRNKKSLTLDLQKEEGKEVFKKLVKVADVVVENMRAGVMDRLGLGYSVLKGIKPDLVYVAISGYGHHKIYQSPFGDKPVFDPAVQALGGLMYRPAKEGDPPVYLGFPITDQYAGLVAAYAVMLALWHRSVTGQGQFVDIAMYDTSMTLNELAINLYDLTKEVPPHGRSATSSPYGPFKMKDGYIGIGVVGEVAWRRFARAMGRPDLLERPELSSGYERAKRQESVLRPIIEAWGADKTMDEACEILTQQGIAAAEVQDVPDLFTCPHVASRKMLLDLDDPVAGKVKVAGNPIKMALAPEPEVTPPPQLGQHSEEILAGWTRIGRKEIARLRERGIV